MTNTTQGQVDGLPEHQTIFLQDGDGNFVIPAARFGGVVPEFITVHLGYPGSIVLRAVYPSWSQTKP